MADVKVKVTELPAIPLEDFTSNDSFLIIDNGRARRITRDIFQVWLQENVRGERGEQGVAGRDGVKGTNGLNGSNGENGLSAFQLAVTGGFGGSIEEWFSSLNGNDGSKGEDGGDGWSPVFSITSVGAYSYLRIDDWVGGTGDKPTLVGYVSDNGVVQSSVNASNLKGAKGDIGVQGEVGQQGSKGDKGDTGFQGLQGDSAYEIAVLNSFEGTEEDWLESLNAATLSKSPDNILTKKLDGLYAPPIDPNEVASAIDALPDKNIMTDTQKQKLEDLKTSKYLGTFLTTEDIPVLGAVAGNYADVDSGAEDVDTERWIFDVQNGGFVKSSSSSSEETAESIKIKYESNPDTNAFTDAEKLKLEGLEGGVASGGVIDKNGGGTLKIWTGTQEEYDLVLDKDPSTLYVVKYDYTE